MKKLSIRTLSLTALVTSLLLPGLITSTRAQQPTYDLPKSKYGLPVVNDVEIYKKIIATDPNNELVDMRQILPNAQFDVTYAKTTNFLKRKLYPSEDVFMRKPAALALHQASDNLKKQGFGLLLFDGYRPYAITVLF
jgi:D-alanyl-D-alanine dipeptidase